MFIVESRSRPRGIRVYYVIDDGARLSNGRPLSDVGDGSRDGFRCAAAGNLWCGWGTGAGLDGVVVFAPDGTMIGRIALPERCANLCFGGVKRNRLFMAASQSLYAVYVNTEGAAGG
jgi:gluconolactonase